MSSEGAKKNPDNLNTIGIITVGAVGSALVYLSIVGLQAFYVDETAVVDEVRSFGDQEKVRADLKATQTGNITDFLRKGNAADGRPVVSIGIDRAKSLIVADARVDAANLVPMVGRSDKGTIQPIFGRPVALPPPPTDAVPPPADGSVPGAVPPDGAAPPGAAPGTAPATGATPGQPNPGTGTPNSPTGNTPSAGDTPAPATREGVRPATPAPAVQPPAAGSGSAMPPAAAPAQGGGH
jgi:hypothetical protein